jgi:regulator of replication initiation timing
VGLKPDVSEWALAELVKENAELKTEIKQLKYRVTLDEKNHNYTQRRFRELIRYVIDNYESEVRSTDDH